MKIQKKAGVLEDISEEELDKLLQNPATRTNLPFKEPNREEISRASKKNSNGINGKAKFLLSKQGEIRRILRTCLDEKGEIKQVDFYKALREVDPDLEDALHFYGIGSRFSSNPVCPYCSDASNAVYEGIHFGVKGNLIYLSWKRERV